MKRIFLDSRSISNAIAAARSHNVTHEVPEKRHVAAAAVQEDSIPVVKTKEETLFQMQAPALARIPDPFIVKSGSNALRRNDALFSDKTADAYLQSINTWYRLTLSATSGELHLSVQDLRLWTIKLDNNSLNYTLHLGPDGFLKLTNDKSVVVWEAHPVASFLRLNNDGSVLLYNPDMQPIGALSEARSFASLPVDAVFQPGQGIVNGAFAVFLHPGGRSLIPLRLGSGPIARAQIRFPSADNTGAAYSVVLRKLDAPAPEYALYTHDIKAGTDNLEKPIARVKSMSDVNLTVSENDGSLILQDADRHNVWSSGDAPGPCAISQVSDWSPCGCDTAVRTQTVSYDDGSRCPASATTQSCQWPSETCRLIIHSQSGLAWGIRGDSQHVHLQSAESSMYVQVVPSGDDSGLYAIIEVHPNQERCVVPAPDATITIKPMSREVNAYVWALSRANMRNSAMLIMSSDANNKPWFVSYDGINDTLKLSDSVADSWMVHANVTAPGIY